MTVKRPLTQPISNNTHTQNIKSFGHFWIQCVCLDFGFVRILPTQKSLTIYNTSQLFINLEGCVNTLRSECTDFLQAYGRDGENNTAQSRYSCFYNKVIIFLFMSSVCVRCVRGWLTNQLNIIRFQFSAVRHDPNARTWVTCTYISTKFNFNILMCILFHHLSMIPPKCWHDSIWTRRGVNLYSSLVFRQCYLSYHS